MQRFYHYLMEYQRYRGFIGIAVIIGIAFLFSTNRSRVKKRTIINGLLLQGAFAVFILKTNLGCSILEHIARGFKSLYSFAGEGARFVFGNLVDASAGWGFVFALHVAAIIIFFGAFTSLLFHLGIISYGVRMVSALVCPLLGTSGAETLCATANSMLGQTEAPLLIKNYLEHMTESEILVVMVSGFATISGSLLAVYGSIGIPMVHLLSASVMSIPASLLISKILLPERDDHKLKDVVSYAVVPQTKNVLDAISQGTIDGMRLAANVIAMLISFISLIALVNALLVWVHCYTLDQMFAFLFAPIAYLIGISSSDMYIAGNLLGQKVVINEFIAYTKLLSYHVEARSHIILTYALCGFANFSSIGIQIGGIGALVPGKREMLTRLGLRALLGGTLANLLNAALASLLI